MFIRELTTKQFYSMERRLMNKARKLYKVWYSPLNSNRYIVKYIDDRIAIDLDMFKTYSKEYLEECENKSKEYKNV